MQPEAFSLLLVAAIVNVIACAKTVEEFGQTRRVLATERYFWKDHFADDPYSNTFFSLITLPGRMAGYGLSYVGHGFGNIYKNAQTSGKN